MGLRSLALLLAALVACKGGPAPPSGFLESPERMATDEELPFDKVWREPGVDWTPYTEIMVAPVNTNHLMEMSWWDGLSFAGNMQALNDIMRHYIVSCTSGRRASYP